GRAEGKAEGLVEGKAEGRAEGLVEGRAEGKAEGLVEGRVEGEQSKANEIARTLKALGKMTITEIAAATGLSETEIEKI
ncbi:MAG: hypothetical protein K6F33_14000, partial [Bacteroidales bacterium]|nr:hypothetical protein [Bacteroidales bacterium]